MNPQVILGIVLCLLGAALNLTAAFKYRRSLRILRHATEMYGRAKLTYQQSAELLRGRRPQ